MPKREGGLCPILDFGPINRALGKRPFRMLTLKQILAQIHPGDWFASVDLKDAYFHIQIAPHHRQNQPIVQIVEDAPSTRSEGEVLH